MTYIIEVSHLGLHKHRIIRDKDPGIAQSKADNQAAIWNQQWARRQEQEARARAKHQALNYKEEHLQEAADVRQEGREAIEAARTLLAATLDKDDRIEWSSLYDRTLFTKPRPQQLSAGLAPSPPDQAQEEFQPQIGWLDRLIPGRRRRRIQEAQNAYAYAFERHTKALSEYNERKLKNTAYYEEQLHIWNEQKSLHEAKTREHNFLVNEREHLYRSSEPGAITLYCEMVLARSEYPDFIQQDFAVSFDPAVGLLAVDYILPLPDDLPSLIDVRYVASRDEFDKKYLKTKERSDLYESVIYQLCLRTIHEIFESDAINAIQSMVFNGWTIFPILQPAMKCAAVSYLLMLRRTSSLDLTYQKLILKHAFVH